MNNRTILAVSGPDRVSFLQGLVTNDVAKAASNIIYAALLTPQGKFIADFFVIGQADRLLVDVASSHAAILQQRLTMYRLRANVAIEDTDINVACGVGDTPDRALDDPRSPALGWRHYGGTAKDMNIDWDALRVTHMIPMTGVELGPDTYILEARFEALHGVDFKKGCFVGQEIVARMKHKTTLRKGLAQVAITGIAQAGDTIYADEKAIGTLHTISGKQGIAYLRFDRANGVMTTASAELTLCKDT